MGIFYARNKFIMGLYKGKRITDPIPRVAQFVCATLFRYHYLQHVTILWGELSDFKTMDLAPLVRICWGRKDQKCIFNLVSPVDEPNGRPGEMTRMMNATLRQLVADTFDIRKYGCQMLSIHMEHSIDDKDEMHSTVSIVFGDYRRYRYRDATWVRKLESKDQCETFELSKNPERLNLTRLPLSVQQKIFAGLHLERLLRGVLKKRGRWDTA